MNKSINNNKFILGFAILLIPIVLLSNLIINFDIYFTLFLILSIIFWPILYLRVFFGKNMIPLE